MHFLMSNFFCKVQPALPEEPSYNYHKKPNFFSNQQLSAAADQEILAENVTSISLSELYDKLKHADFECETNVQHEKLRPILRPYQVQGVKWMLMKEQRTVKIPTEFIKIAAKRNPQKVFYFNERTLELYDLELEDTVEMPTGGMLCDEMGLGKTVEILGLILCNPRRNKRKISDLEKEEEGEKLPEPSVLEEDYKFTEENCQCICGKTDKNKKDKIICSNCKTWQHQKCVMKNAPTIIKSAKDYLCPVCWKNVTTKIESATTLICSPASIKNQWVEEINKHVRDKDFKVLVYNGVSGSGWISPNQLVEYDVIVTDFNVLTNEIYYTNTMDRNMRREKRYVKPNSPLTFVNFWRVCLDEAQMVENASNQVSKMVKTLTAKHRWAVTGTPVENNIKNLVGLLFFLDIYPYSDTKVWNQLCNDFCSGKNQHLIEVMKKFFWRTCKKNVINEIGIPPQTEITHFVQMSDLQSFFYRTEHLQTEAEFKRYAKRIFSDDETMSHMSSTTIKNLLEHIRKLRQDCTVPCIFHRNLTEAGVVKQTLTPNELQEHMVSNNEIECKSQLRTIASSLNGLAAIHIAKKDFSKAINCYKSVLRWANDYTGTVHVDALLKIHTLHNLLDIIQLTNNESELEHKQNYMEECNKLEWKYINNFYEVVKSMQANLNKQTEVLNEAKLNLNDFKGDWWRNFIYSLEQSSKQNILFDKIRNELIRSYGSDIPDE